jgi:hypothetical protein
VVPVITEERRFGGFLIAKKKIKKIGFWGSLVLDEGCERRFPAPVSRNLRFSN